ncbi:MAG TPA: hypothetical protein VFM31_11900 [Nitrososphaeraceae archaeon]|nr:hypothetical protein [Nitrososphaeraceae archaeon]
MRIKDGFFWNNGFRVILFSISSLMLAYLIYTKFTNPYYNDLVMVTPILLNLSITIIIITFMSSIALCFGLWNIYVSKTTNSNNLRYYISIPFKEKKYVVMMILTGISYGIIFSFLSQIFVFNNSSENSFDDNKSIPSIKIVPCCNTIGYVPMTYIYLTENFFIFLIPINIVLIFIVSFLVGLNLTINIFIIKKLKEGNNKQSKLLGSIGATCGLFIGCPTCAGSIIAAILGIGAGTTTISLLASFQTFFIALSIPALICAPFLIAKTLKKKITKDLV